LLAPLRGEKRKNIAQWETIKFGSNGSKTTRDIRRIQMSKIFALWVFLWYFSKFDLKITASYNVSLINGNLKGSVEFY